MNVYVDRKEMFTVYKAYIDTKQDEFPIKKIYFNFQVKFVEFLNIVITFIKAASVTIPLISLL